MYSDSESFPWSNGMTLRGRGYVFNLMCSRKTKAKAHLRPPVTVTTKLHNFQPDNGTETGQYVIPLCLLLSMNPK